jgi:hypothetical protein
MKSFTYPLALDRRLVRKVKRSTGDCPPPVCLPMPFSFRDVDCFLDNASANKRSLASDESVGGGKSQHRCRLVHTHILFILMTPHTL